MKIITRKSSQSSSNLLFVFQFYSQFDFYAYIERLEKRLMGKDVNQAAKVIVERFVSIFKSRITDAYAKDNVALSFALFSNEMCEFACALSNL